MNKIIVLGLIVCIVLTSGCIQEKDINSCKIVKRSGEIDIVLNDGLYSLDNAKITIKDEIITHIDNGTWVQIKEHKIIESELTIPIIFGINTSCNIFGDCNISYSHNYTTGICNENQIEKEVPCECHEWGCALYCFVCESDNIVSIPIEINATNGTLDIEIYIDNITNEPEINMLHIGIISFDYIKLCSSECVMSYQINENNYNESMLNDSFIISAGLTEENCKRCEVKE